MAFATVGDVETRLGRELTETETNQIESLIDGATAIVTQAAGRDDAWADSFGDGSGETPLPQIIKTVTIELVARVADNPSTLKSIAETVGSYQVSKTYGDVVGFELTQAEKMMVSRAANGSTVTSVHMPSIISEVFPNTEIDGAAEDREESLTDEEPTDRGLTDYQDHIVDYGD